MLSETDNVVENNLNLMEEDEISESQSDVEIKPVSNSDKEIDGIKHDDWRLLEKVKTTQREDYLKVAFFLDFLVDYFFVNFFVI